MARYHINPANGNPGVCSAQKACPFGDLETQHYSSAADARTSYEKSMAAFKPSLKKLTRESLKQAVLDEASLPPEQLKKLAEAIELADVLHEGQTRKATINGRTGTPYIEHPLRNTLRLVRLGVNDLAVLNAALLHDTVEDCAPRFCEINGIAYESEDDAREKLSIYIGENFGLRTKELVLSVTNPHHEIPLPTVEAKHLFYQNGVAAEIESDPGTYLVKWADVIDNAGSLHHARPHEVASAKKQAVKYLPTIPSFLKSLETHSDHYPPTLRSALREKMLKTEARLKDLLTWVIID